LPNRQERSTFVDFNDSSTNPRMKASHSKKKTALVFGISGDKGQFVARGLLDSQSYDTVYGVTHAVTAHTLDVMVDVTFVRGRDGDDNDDGRWTPTHPPPSPIVRLALGTKR